MVACTLLTLMPSSPAAAEGPSPPEPTVIRADNASLVLKWKAPSFSARRVRAEDGRLANVIEAAGWSTAGVPGDPSLPTASAIAVVPPTGEIGVAIESSPPRRIRLSLPLKREPAPQVPDGYEQPGVDPSSWQGEGHGADEAVTVEELGWMRGHRLVQVSFSPLTYDEEHGALEVVEEVRVRLTFAQPPERAPKPWSPTRPPGESDGFAPLLEDIVVNPEQVEDFAREEPISSSSADPVTSAAQVTAAYKIAVTEEGIYELTYEALRDAGLALDGAPPEGLKLRHAGQDVAYAWEDADQDGIFDAGDRILFYARPAPSRWATHDVYWLSSGESGRLMSTRSGSPAGVGQEGALWATAEAEENTGDNNYLPRFPSERDGDHWYWAELSRDYGMDRGDYDKRFPISLLEPDPAGAAGTLSLYLQGTSMSEDLDPDHRVAVSLNGHALGHVTWDGLAYHAATLTAPTGALEAGANEVRLTLARSGGAEGVDKMWLDAVEIRYPVAGLRGQPARLEGEAGRNAYTVSGLDSGGARIYDVSDPLAPQVVTGATTEGSSVFFADADASTRTYYVLSEDQVKAPEWIERAQDLPQPSEAPDYLIISHSDFIPAVAPLVEQRAKNGLVVHTVPVEAVYDAFGDGRVDPQAIRDYVAHAYETWGTAYLLLVGDGTHDPLNNYVSPDHGPTFVPPYLGTFDPYWGEVPSDNRFATVDGDDRLPDLYVGRLPVNTAAEAETVVAKILAYEEAPPSGPWNKPLLFFADAKDGGTDFHFHADEVYNSVPEAALASHTRQRIYYCEEDCTEPHQISDKGVMQETVLSKLNWGALMASWTGHSSWHQWGLQRLFHLDDLGNLNNGGALPIFLQMTCFTSYFSQPTSDTLDESLLRLADGGAVATWGPVGLGLTSAHVKIHRAFLNATLGGEPVELGAATVAARTALPGIYASLWDTYVLFGDPAMGLNLEIDAWPGIYLPLVVRNAGGGN